MDGEADDDEDSRLGFLPLYYGRQDPTLTTTSPDIVFIKSAAEGTTDASGPAITPDTAPQSAVTVAKKAGFPKGRSSISTSSRVARSAR